MEFEWDEAKSAANLVKHGIDFAEAEALWLDEVFVEFDLPFPAEKRSSRVARLRGKAWAAIYTMRGDKTRIISVRRARSGEEQAHERAGRRSQHDPQP